MHLEYTPRDRERFWAKVKKSDGCWLWTCALHRGGYGRFWHSGRYEQAHRIAYILERGPIPDGLIVCHDCPDGDNAACVRPSHLFLGTHLDNSRDMLTKGRHSIYQAVNQASRNPNRCGNGNGMSKLTKSLADEIRQRGATMSAYRLAGEYGVSPKTIYAVLRGETWR